MNGGVGTEGGMVIYDYASRLNAYICLIQPFSNRTSCLIFKKLVVAISISDHFSSCCAFHVMLQLKHL